MEGRRGAVLWSMGQLEWDGVLITDLGDVERDAAQLLDLGVALERIWRLS